MIYQVVPTHYLNVMPLAYCLRRSFSVGAKKSLSKKRKGFLN
jgi:hypothetical protein